MLWESRRNQTAGVYGFSLYLKILVLKREEKSGISKSVYLIRQNMLVSNLERNEKQSIAVVKGFFCIAAKVIDCINPGRVQTLKESSSAVSP